MVRVPNDVVQHEISEYFSITVLGMNLQAILLGTNAGPNKL